ncbi:hypothetical protein IQE94_05430 [Synechocystis sp. PCC 7339]|uniref:hypothetical protein n=1 Tax=unclassified Synechocystis TaxID=2640012 RepID=UPI001BAEDFCB|nr:MULTISPECIES: hypothetical protein [unclassified Synechocystis]QUS62434.1 hypothetical protein HTZ78_13395 [Synechocystis sp. PCC 7338]UAJ74384.1 hypothetical protein IQE94_05430 [Synechocystis sp. PCC 7339]
MTNNDNIRLEQISEDLEAQRHSLNEQGQRLDRIETILTNLVTEIKIYDSKLDTYQKASQQTVNIAFGLLATSALAIIIPAVLNR